MGSLCCAGRQSPLSADFKDDMDEFDKAYDTNDIPGFVRLCRSRCRIEKLDQKMHPWAAEPESIGALAATQLAILACKKDHPKYKDLIREAGGIPVLINIMDYNETDRTHAAVVALSFLSVDNQENALAMYQAGALPRLIHVMKMETPGARSAAAQTARNIYVLDVEYRKEFVRNGGLVQLLNLLETNSESNLSADWAQLEVLYHIEDLILNKGEEIYQMVQAVQNTGAAKVLLQLRESSNADISEAAGLLLIRITE